jgi:uncharacterized RDD family membrane protein YckC
MSSPASAPAPRFSFGGYSAEENSLQGVGFAPRLAARVIDLVVHYFIALCSGFFIGIVVLIVGGLTGRDTATLLSRAQNTGVTAFLLALLGSTAYHTICEGLHGSTLGKLICGLVVLQEDRKPCGMRSALLRSLGYYVDALFFGAIGFVKMKDTVLQQRHGDAWAGTVVCKRKAVAELVRGPGRFIGVFLLAGFADSVCLSFGVLLSLL